jgi:hypothetical protein
MSYCNIGGSNPYASVVLKNGEMRPAQKDSQSRVATVISAIRAKWVHGINANDKRFGRHARQDKHNREMLAIFSSLPGVVLTRFPFLMSLQTRKKLD